MGLMGNAKIMDQCLNHEFHKRRWIIDSGETHRISGDISWLRDTRNIPGLLGIANGKKIVETHEGCV